MLEEFLVWLLGPHVAIAFGLVWVGITVASFWYRFARGRWPWEEDYERKLKSQERPWNEH